MSDRQKGLVDVLRELFPHSNHRTCVRHLYNNFKKQHSGKAFKDGLWKAVRATYDREYEDAMSEVKSLSRDAYDWLSEKDPRNWSKAFFPTTTKCDMLLNNVCESFNKFILETRTKPIITMLEAIKTKIMQRIAKKSDEADKWIGPLCPKIQKKLETSMQMSARCWATNAGGNKYQVSYGPHSQHVVNLTEHTCSCRKWDLTGIPCHHAISAILMKEERPESYVDDCYKKITQQAIYSHLMNPVRGPDQWARQTYCEPILPPTIRRPPGRPHKKRRKEADEPIIHGVRVTKKGVTLSCSKCKKTGHNVRTCKGIVGGNSSSSRTPRTRSAHPQQAPTTSTTVPQQQPTTFVTVLQQQPTTSTSTRLQPPSRQPPPTIRPKLPIKRSSHGTWKQLAPASSAPTQEAQTTTRTSVPAQQASTQPPPIQVVRWMLNNSQESSTTQPSRNL
ncbi:hypothetical protein HRI_001482400 [Hibiscus trionum]|uniref:SWIM-type domain-containing protein n=1 Tax=Hibiscus trionum TaxID=183268 RepID=A0A9W7HJ52_HIBTR|nr:hypothetical protein HRI_001482400 [Hibiscus trionum]